MSGIPGWVGPTVAISLVIIALAYGAIAAVVLLAVRRTARELAELRREIGPAIQAVNGIAQTGSEIGARVKDEALAVLDTSRRLRRGAIRGARRLQGRLEDLDALYEVVHGEVENTALDVAATLRTVRTGASALSRIKRLLFRGGSRR
jgi:hypothetical protein